MAKTSSITKKRDLRTGGPIWLDGSSPLIRCERRLERQSFDIVIVGAGISGAALAYRLRRKGRKLLVVDRCAPLHGSTAASTALLEFAIDTPLFELSRRIGPDKARRAWLRSLKAVDDLRNIVSREKIRCGWRDSSSLYLAGDAHGHRALEMEVEERERAGVPGVYVSRRELRESFGIDRTGAILSAGAAQADPVQLAAGLLKLAIKEGASVCSPVTISAIAADESGVILTTDEDAEIKTRQAVFCTGYEILKSIPSRGHSLKSTWALASAPTGTAPKWLADHIVWEASDPYLYLRCTKDRRIVAGGEDEQFSEAHADTKLLREKTSVIAEKIRDLIPGLRFRIEHRWGGNFGESDTGLPFIDRVPGHPNCYAVMGFGGNGITYAIIAAEVIAHMIGGRDDPDADLYRFAERPR